MSEILWEEVRDDAVTPVLWFYDHGIRVFPTRNKIPAIAKGSSWKDYRCTREEAARFREYSVPGGVREGYDDGLTIVDTDEDADETWVRRQIAQVALPDTPFKVRTRQGWHRYFRTRGPLLSYIHRDGHTIENRNRGLYVVGPGSVRPDGVAYRSVDWSWRWEDIPFFPDDFLFNDGSCGRISPERTAAAPGESYEFPEAVHKKFRHRELFRLLRSFKGSGVDREMTREIVHLANVNRCRPPLAEDADFECWFARGWDNPDRSFPTDTGLSGLRGL